MIDEFCERPRVELELCTCILCVVVDFLVINHSSYLVLPIEKDPLGDRCLELADLTANQGTWLLSPQGCLC